MGIDPMAVLGSAVVLVFGVFVSAALIGVDLHERRSDVALLAFAAACGAVLAWIGATQGGEAVLRFYPLVVHVPLVALLAWFFHGNVFGSVVAVFTAYLCCQIGKWVGIVVTLAGAPGPIPDLARIVATTISGILLVRYAAEGFSLVLNRRTRDVLVFGTIPTAFYLFDYASTVYTNLLFSGSVVVMESLAFVLCATYLVFVLMYFREVEDRSNAEQLSRLMEIRLSSAEKEIQSFRRASDEIAVIRHDMRHHLARIGSYVQEGDDEGALDYLREISDEVGRTTVRRYCGNETINALLSFYEEKCTGSGIELRARAIAGDELPCTEAQLTAILSNGLDNAYNAVLPLASGRHVDVEVQASANRLLLSIANPYATRPAMRDGMPVAGREGHGLGTRSIRSIVEKCEGNCQFTVDDRLFTLRVVI